MAAPRPTRARKRKLGRKPRPRNTLASRLAALARFPGRRQQLDIAAIFAKPAPPPPQKPSLARVGFLERRALELSDRERELLAKSQGGRP